jgi:UDP-N-acetylmuramate dehydrogenase
MPTEDSAPRPMLSLLTEQFSSALRPHESLARHGTFGVGGPADAWITLTTDEQLLTLVSLARSHAWPLMLVGNGTNVLYADAGARGIVARMALDEWRLEPAEDDQHALLIAGAGVNLPKLVNDLADAGLAGLEWGAGVPGTIGGAVVSNAGAHGQCVADTLRTARVLFTDPADAADTVPPAVRDLPAAHLYLDYRHSRFRAARRVVFDDDGRPVAAPRAPIEPPEMIVGATFLLTRDDPAAIRARVRAYRQHRKDTQPPQPSAGSVFKNPPGDYAGRLIEACGLKGTRLGKAEISPRHANFIVNTGGASAADVVGLIALARRTVRARFGVELELEVEPRGDW